MKKITQTRDKHPARLLNKLVEYCPNIAVTVKWEHDPDAESDWGAEWTKGLRRSAWQPWQSDVCVTIIAGGKLLEGHAYMNGTWEKAKIHPSKSNPDISGYLPQMVEEALDEIAEQGLSMLGTMAYAAILTAQEIVKAELQLRYDEEMNERKT